jgi:hypothetical protein
MPFWRIELRLMDRPSPPQQALTQGVDDALSQLLFGWKLHFRLLRHLKSIIDIDA